MLLKIKSDGVVSERSSFVDGDIVEIKDEKLAKSWIKSGIAELAKKGEAANVDSRGEPFPVKR